MSGYLHFHEDTMSECLPSFGNSASETVRVFSLFRDYIQVILDSANENEEYVKAVRPIVHFIGDRSQALVLLIQNSYLWDAEIIIRPIMEASMKIVFLSFTTAEERQSRIREFWQDLSEVNTLRQSGQAEVVLERTGMTGVFAKGLGPLVLSDEQVNPLREKWPKKNRRTLEQKWSFSEILRFSEEFMRSSFGEGFVRAAAYNYGLSSHLIHCDELGLNLISDHMIRRTQERHKLTNAHAARLLSDCVSYIALVAACISHVLGKAEKDFDIAVQEAEGLFERLRRFTDDFWAYEEDHRM